MDPIAVMVWTDPECNVAIAYLTTVFFFFFLNQPHYGDFIFPIRVLAESLRIIAAYEGGRKRWRRGRRWRRGCYKDHIETGLRSKAISVLQGRGS